MSDLRERQRLKRRQTILDAAASLFKSEGYSKTTVENIASEAEVGVATIYKYFGNKEQIIVELFKPQIQKSIESGEAVIKNPPLEPDAGIADLLDSYWHLAKFWDDRILLRTFATVGLGEQGLAHDVISESDVRLRKQIGALFKIYIRAGRVPNSINVEQMTIIVFSLFNQFYYKFLFDSDITVEEVARDLRRLVPVLFEGWRVAPSKKDR